MYLNHFVTKSVFTESILILLGLTAAASATVPGVHKNILGLGITTSVYPIEGIKDIMKIDKSLEEFSLLIKGVSKTISEAENKGVDFLSCY